MMGVVQGTILFELFAISASWETSGVVRLIAPYELRPVFRNANPAHLKKGSVLFNCHTFALNELHLFFLFHGWLQLLVPLLDIDRTGSRGFQQFPERRTFGMTGRRAHGGMS